MSEIITTQKTDKFADERIGFIKTFFEEFFHQGWQFNDRIISLSGMTREEINQLPKNTFRGRIYTSILRSWQKDLRSLIIRKDPRSLEGNKANCDFVNPFNPSGEKVYATEYAQLVNLAARKANKSGSIDMSDVLKLTLLATFQNPVDSEKFTQYKAICGFFSGDVSRKFPDLEIEFLKSNADFSSYVPLTLERIQDREFVKNLRFPRLLKIDKLPFYAALLEVYLRGKSSLK